MMMKRTPLYEHFCELKNRTIVVSVCFVIAFTISYYISTNIYLILVKPLANIIGNDGHQIIYTGLTEAFFTYIKISAFAALMITMPVISWQTYGFIAPGLYQDEKLIAVVILAFAPILFWAGSACVFYFVIPKAWQFFLSFELRNENLPLLLEARISEYLDLVMHLIIAFGCAAEIPIILTILNITGIVSTKYLIQKRRVAIVINFIIAGIITPPDVLSQIALAMPMVFLYEISILACKILEKRGQNARYKVD